MASFTQSLLTLVVLSGLGGHPSRDSLPLQVDLNFLKDSKAPPRSKALLQFALDSLGKKVGEGQCADLAHHGLKMVKGQLPRLDKSGKPVWGKLIVELSPGSIQTPKVLPGDIIQMYDVKIEQKSETSFYWQTAPMHTAIVTKVEPQVLHVLHQNWGSAKDGQIVAPGTFRLNDLQKGVIQVFRPQ